MYCDAKITWNFPEMSRTEVHHTYFLSLHFNNPHSPSFKKSVAHIYTYSLSLSTHPTPPPTPTIVTGNQLPNCYHLINFPQIFKSTIYLHLPPTIRRHHRLQRSFCAGTLLPMPIGILPPNSLKHMGHLSHGA